MASLLYRRDDLVHVVKGASLMDDSGGQTLPYRHDDDALDGLAGLCVHHLASPGARRTRRSGTDPETDRCQ
jgi:hypothetical protein